MERRTFYGVVSALLLTTMLVWGTEIRLAKSDPAVLRVPVDYPTIQEAVDAASLGDIVYVYAGTYYENVVIDKSLDLMGENRETTIIDGSLAGNVVYVTASSVSVHGFTVRNSGTAWQNNFGIYIFGEGSDSNSVSDNIITNNGCGIRLEGYLGDSSNNVIDGNSITDNGAGLSLWLSSNNRIYRNNVQNNNYGVGIGVAMNSNDNIITENNITDNGGYGLEVAQSGRNTITANKIVGNGADGIWLGKTSHSIITANNIASNGGSGIRVEWGGGGDTIFANNIKNNLVGIYLWLSWGAPKIYHNNILDNVDQADVYSGPINTWDDGYPSGGNYWSDYEGTDVFSGPLQDTPGSDGIGDTPYIIEAPYALENIDHYPLINPWTPTAILDIDLDTLNLKSMGRWITAYIQLPEGYSPANINASTILLNRTIAPFLDPKYGFVTNSSGYLVDHNNDGVLERMLKFDRATVQSLIYNQGIRYGDVALTLTGELLDGTSFEGTDVVFVNYAGDVNSDGTINILDTAAISAHWYPGPPIGPLSYDLNADFNRDEAVDIIDVGILSVNWGQTTP